MLGWRNRGERASNSPHAVQEQLSVRAVLRALSCVVVAFLLMTGKHSHTEGKSSGSDAQSRVKLAYHQAQDQARQRAQASDEARDYASSSEKYRHRSGRTSHAGSAAVPGKRPLIVALVVLVVVVIAAVGLVVNGSLSKVSGSGKLSGSGSSALASSAYNDKLPTPIMAESEGIKLHSAVAMDDLTEILIHNASYSYAEPITTKLKEADNEKVMKEHGTHRNASKQPTGNKWMTGKFIRCYRAGNAGPRMSAIDCGGKAGTQVYAPVSGKVVLVKKYKLYDMYTDYQVHIQPTGREDLDVVLIHLTHVSCKAGDTVEAGKTPIARIRDVYKLIGGSMQLKYYTAKGDDGNHTHIQVNNANAKNYHGLDDLKKSADNKKSGSSSSSSKES